MEREAPKYSMEVEDTPVAEHAAYAGLLGPRERKYGDDDAPSPKRACVVTPEQGRPCPRCTFVNPLAFLACDLCGGELAAVRKMPLVSPWSKATPANPSFQRTVDKKLIGEFVVFCYSTFSGVASVKAGDGLAISCAPNKVVRSTSTTKRPGTWNRAKQDKSVVRLSCRGQGGCLWSLLHAWCYPANGCLLSRQIKHGCMHQASLLIKL